MDAEIVAVVGVQHGPLVEGYEIRVKAGQDDALVCQLDLADGLFQRQYALFARVPPQNVGIGRIGVGDMPSSPGFSVATPCMVLQPVGSPENSGRPEWLCPSTKPGQRVSPSRSTVRRESSLVVRGSTAAMNPSCTLTEPQNHGLPAPSTIRALQKSVSNMGCLAERGGNGPERRGSRPGTCPRGPPGIVGAGRAGGYPTARRSALRRRP